MATPKKHHATGANHVKPTHTVHARHPKHVKHKAALRAARHHHKHA